MRIFGQKIESLMLQTMGAVYAPKILYHFPLPQHEETKQAVPAAYTWKISNFTRKLLSARASGDFGAIKSEPFFSSHGYKMMISVNLNEELSGFSGFMGVYIHLLRGDQDGFLPWPFAKCYTFILVDKHDVLSLRQNIEFEITPEGQREFTRPSRREPENEGWGETEFVKHSTLHTRQYIRDDAVLIEVVIDP